MPEGTHRNLLDGRGGHQMKSAIRGQSQCDSALSRFEFVGAAGGELSVKVNIAGCVRSKNARGVHSRKLNVARRPDVRAHQVALNVADRDLTAAGFEID